MEPGPAHLGPKRLKNIDTMGSLVNPACQIGCAPPGSLPSVDGPTAKDSLTEDLKNHHLGKIDDLRSFSCAVGVQKRVLRRPQSPAGWFLVAENQGFGVSLSMTFS